MRTMLCLTAFCILTAPAALASNFATAPGWAFDCEVSNVARQDYLPQEKTGAFRLLWPRDRGTAYLLGKSGAGYKLREIPGYVDATGQGTAHFYASPETGAFDADGTASRSVTDGFRVRLVSVRSDGFIALTQHMIEYGDMRAASQEGTCKITELKAEDR